MHVGLNALFLEPGASGGPETYMRGLVPALAQERPDLRLTLFTTRAGAAKLRADGWTGFCEVVALPCEEGQRLRRGVAEQVLLPLAARRRHVDVLHSLASVAPIRPGVRAVVTLHDVTFLLRPTFSRVTTIGMRETIVRPARRADGLLTGSAAARDLICEVLGLDPARFTVVHHGAGRPPDVAPRPDAELRAEHRLDGAQVVLNVGAKRPHKNQALLVRALPHLDEDVVVVLAGHPEPYAEEVRALAVELGVADRLRMLDYVPDADLEGLWRLAACAAFPTLGEGFGLPVAEAMARGVAVACSDIPVLREVGDGLAHYFDPHDPVSAAAAIRVAAGDGRAAERVEHAAGFSWAAAARATAAVYDRVAAA